jgi:ubiquinone/menaquinone biosynthesis C-methylase UbiE/uncharacterized protein YbaR (Trm112 family)
MLKSLVKDLLCPSCRSEKLPLKMIPFRESQESIMDGILVCPFCSAWYPIQDSLLEFVIPSLLDRAGLKQFFNTYAKELAASNCSMPVIDIVDNNLEAQVKQREHFDWYATNEQQDYTSYQNTPFWRAIDILTFSKWGKKLTCADGWMLDIGCADGRSAFQWSELVKHVIGCDISKAMIRKAINRARLLKVENRMCFFVGDADSLPLRNDSFDYISTYGVLHHLPHPDQTFRDIIRILKPDGIFFASENNQSSFRGAFDFLMRMSPLWVELAGEEPLISSRMIRQWSEGLPIALSFFSTVFIPPHLINLVGNRLSLPLLRFTDNFFRLIPWFRHQGGLIVIESRKNLH